MTDTLQHIFAYDPGSPLIFTQFYFWAFFALVYAVFSLVHSKRLLRNTFLLFASWFFYYKTSGLALLILLFVTLSDWLLAKGIYRLRNAGERREAGARALMVVSLVIDLGLLCYFKYAWFLTNMLNDLLGTSWRVFDVFAFVGNGLSTAGRFSVDSIVLPVGISFYLFQSISYTVDVYMGRLKPVGNLLDYGLFVSFFPQLVAGPIVRATEFVPQLYKPFRLSRRQFGMAVFWILNGLVKKLLLSDWLAVHYIDRVFDTPLLYSGFENLLAVFCYSLQVYADFSGYTDIAIGVAMLMGFYLPANFNSPYKAVHPQDFWRRWHMSLSRWLKTYLYIPLGGNREASFGTWFWVASMMLIVLVLTGSWVVSAVLLGLTAVVALLLWLAPGLRKKIYANLNSLITMLLGGLWHGASWNFVIWGGLNGFGMIANKIWRDLNRHWQMLVLTLLTAGLWALKHYYPYPVWNLFAVWAGVVWAVDVLRYAGWLVHRLMGRDKPSVAAGAAGTGWAVLQTFVFITFTRLFFRSGSNLDPETANRVAWETARNMVTQIGSAWDAQLPPMVLQYSNILLVFVLGMLIHWLPDRFKRWYRLQFAGLPLWLMLLLTVAAVCLIWQFTTPDAQAFIYFQF
ncbi:MAG: MBOAT family protein [Paludibacteraceae bacterium]|nr:MBOAT family protein [Paludibacteraceae bacterium]